MVRSCLVRALFRQVVTTGQVEDPLGDALDALRVDPGRADMVRHVDELPEASTRAALAASLAHPRRPPDEPHSPVRGGVAAPDERPCRHSAGRGQGGAERRLRSPGRGSRAGHGHAVRTRAHDRGALGPGADRAALSRPARDAAQRDAARSGSPSSTPRPGATASRTCSRSISGRSCPMWSARLSALGARRCLTGSSRPSVRVPRAHRRAPGAVRRRHALDDRAVGARRRATDPPHPGRPGRPAAAAAGRSASPTTTCAPRSAPPERRHRRHPLRLVGPHGPARPRLGRPCAHWPGAVRSPDRRRGLGHRRRGTRGAPGRERRLTHGPLAGRAAASRLGPPCRPTP